MLVADVTDHQVRGYSTEGHLLWFQGGEGHGPGEFTHPLAVERVGDLIAAVDLGRRMTIWDPEKKEEPSVQNIPDLAVDDIDALDSNRVLLSTRAPGLTIWNIERGSRERDFFTPTIYDEISQQFRSFTSLQSSILEDRIATVVSLYDTVYIHSTQGVEIARYSLGIPNMSRPIPVAGARLREWYTSSQTVEPFWLNPKRILVSFVDRSSPPVDGVTQYGLAILDLESGETTLVVDTPRLHFVDGADLFFDDPSFIEGNHIVRARFRER